MSSSYSDETVRTKLSALNDSQDAIVAVAQWIMFHRCAITTRDGRQLLTGVQASGEAVYRALVRATKGVFPP